MPRIHTILPTILLVALSAFTLNACADATVPQARNVDIPSPITAKKRQKAVNERPDSVMYLPLGEDVLVPERLSGDKMPSDKVGPFELRSETLAGALQLILADYDISIAFETEQGLTRKVTVANLKGDLDKVVNRVCSLADLYCSYEDETLVVKDTQTFTVTLPPLASLDGEQEFIDDVIQGLSAVIGESGAAPVSDPTTRTLIYSATQRTSQLADNYFQRLRANTAMIVFETYIWEVSLGAGNSMGIDWEAIDSFGKFNTSVSINGSVGADFTNPISIGLPTTQALGASPTELVEFLSQYGAVKTISQPQITVLSGASAELRVADTENYVSEVSQTINGDNTTTSVDTDSVDSGFTLSIGSSWDKSTVYANVNVNLTNVDQIEDFTFSDGGSGGTDTIIQLPQTTERELTTQIRVRPGDSVLIAGLVRERDNFNSRGPGFMQPVVPDSRTAQTDNLELVILLRPRVIVYTDAQNNNYKKFVQDKIDARSFSSAPASLSTAAPVPTVAPVPVAPLPTPRIVRQPAKMAPASVVTPEPIVPIAVAPQPVVSSQPVSIQPRLQDRETYIPQNSGYSPRYVSKNYETMPTRSIALQPLAASPSGVSTQPFFEGRISDVNAASSSISSNNVNSYSNQNIAVTPVAPQVTNTTPLSQDVYNSARSINVYEAYERSLDSSK